MTLGKQRFTTQYSKITNHFILFKILFIFRERGREGKREGEKRGWVASCTAPAGDLAHNPGMCPDWESNQQPFGLQGQCPIH